MKKLLFIATLFSICFAACKKKTSETIPTGFQWPAGTGEYAPYTLNSTFTFETVSGTPSVTDSFTYTVVKDTLIGGLNFRKLESNKPAIAATYYTNYAANIITEITYNVNFQGVVTVPIIKQTVLKDDVPVANTWSELLSVTVQGFNVPVTFDYTLLQKDIVKNILGKDYPSTYEVKQTISIPQNIATLAGIPASITVNNFYAKGVGRVQRDANNGYVKIKRYNVIK
jgi:hypothetical protein